MEQLVLRSGGIEMSHLRRLIGCSVVDYHWDAKTAGLELKMKSESGKTTCSLLIEDSWEFSSCMMAASSGESSRVDLIGLSGAILTDVAVEAGDGRIDLRFYRVAVIS